MKNNNPNLNVMHLAIPEISKDALVATTNIQKSKENEDSVAALLLAITRLDSEKIKYLVVNNVLFQRKNFEFKNGKFNRSKAIELLTWQYHRDILDDILER